MLITAPGATLQYDGLGCMAQITAAGVTTRFLHDSITLIAEYSGTNVLLRRHVHGPGTDEPIVTYEGTTLTDRRFLMRGAVRRWRSHHQRGSIVSIANGTGTVTAINAYDEYGIGSTTISSTTTAGTTGRFGYTGQVWLPELGLYHYRARIYSPTLGRFLQTDPIGYGDGMNLYAYVGGDPVNYVDPLGLASIAEGISCSDELWIEYTWIGTPDGPRVYNEASIHRHTTCSRTGGPTYTFAMHGGREGPSEDPNTSVVTARSENCPSVPSRIPGYAVMSPRMAIEAAIVRGLANRASADRFPSLAGVDDSRDAYRHVFVAVELARRVGGSQALGGLNGNEYQGMLRGALGARGYTAASRRMDNHNNYLGVLLADDPRFQSMTTEQIVEWAFSNGCVRTAPR